MNKNRRTKRGRRKKNEKILNIFSTNCAGLKNKLQSFKSELKYINASIFTVQETYFSKKGTFKMKDFEIFESIRKK